MSHRASASSFHVNVAVVTEFFDLAHSLTVWCGFVLGKRLKRHLDQGKQLSVFDFHLVGTHNLTTVFRSRFGERIGNPDPAPVDGMRPGLSAVKGKDRATRNTTYGTVNADVLADKDPHFQRGNFCSIIRESPWLG